MKIHNMLDKLLRQKLVGLEKPVGSQDWAVISKALDDSKSRRSYTPIIMLAVLLAATGLLSLPSSNTAGDSAFAQTAGQFANTLDRGQNQTSGLIRTQMGERGQNAEVANDNLEGANQRASASISKDSKANALSISDRNRYFVKFKGASRPTTKKGNVRNKWNATKRYAGGREIVEGDTSIESERYKETLIFKEVTTSVADGPSIREEMSKALLGRCIAIRLDSPADTRSLTGLPPSSIKKCKQTSLLQLSGSVMYNTDFSKAQYQGSGNGSVHKEWQNTSNASAQWGLGKGIEGNLNIGLANWRIGLKTGFQWTEVQARNNYQYQVREIPVIDSASNQILGYILTNNGYKADTTTTMAMQFLSIPVGIEIPLLQRSGYKLSGLVGIGINRFSAGEVLAPSPTSLVLSKQSAMNDVNWTLGYQLGISLKVPIKDRLNAICNVQVGYNPKLQQFENYNYGISNVRVGIGLHYQILGR